MADNLSEFNRENFITKISNLRESHTDDDTWNPHIVCGPEMFELANDIALSVTFRVCLFIDPTITDSSWDVCPMNPNDLALVHEYNQRRQIYMAMLDDPEFINELKNKLGL